MNLKIGIIGSGLAGLTAAISLAKKGCEVTVFYINDIEDTNSYRAQAGIALPLSEGDSVKLHAMDTFHTGRYFNDEEVVWFIISKASEAYDFLVDEVGIRFKSIELEGGHSIPRVYSIENEIGKHVMKTLYKRAYEIDVKFVNSLIPSLIIEDNICKGLYTDSGERYIFDAVVVASGGYTGLYKYASGSSANLGIVIGDYILKGGVATNLEFIQFHPTGYIGRDNQVFLITEALRGRGAKLVNDRGERFVNELAPRDIVAREVYKQLSENRTVYLDATKVVDIEKFFPHLVDVLLKNGLTPDEDLIPIYPVAHYSIGGIYVDIFNHTSIGNLYGVGEVVDSGFHGANRLASNSTLECIVGGLEVARTIIRDRPKSSGTNGSDRYNSIELDIEKLKVLRETMWSYAGLERDETGLKNALNIIGNLELPPQIKELSSAIVKCALERRESRGVHYRKDYPYMRNIYNSRSKYSKDRVSI